MSTGASIPPDARERLEYRLGSAFVRERLIREHDYEHRALGHGRTFFHFENERLFHRLIEWSLHAMGLRQRCRREALNLNISERTTLCKNLPAGFAGFRVLHLSDLHIDLDPAFIGSLCKAVKDATCDACVITGDFRAWTFGDVTPCVQALEQLAGVLPQPAFGVPGNHDTLRMVEPLERAGIRLLINEHTTFRRGSDTLYLAGIDDPHFFELSDLDRALSGVPADGSAVLLGHSPEFCKSAAADDRIGLYLCGHTHGGQLCLPGGRPVIINTRSPVRLTRGAWRCRGLSGYTSRGTGSSSVFARLNCPPEMIVHILKPA